MRRMQAVAVCVVAMCLAASAAAGALRKPLKVFVLAGQSNMVGSGNAQGLPDEMKAPSENIVVPDNPLKPMEWVPHVPKGRMGPEVVFCHAVAKALGEPVGFVKYARGDGWCAFPNQVGEALEVRGQYTLVPLRDPDLGCLSESDIECLDAAIAKYGRLSFNRLRRISHQEAAFNQSDHNSVIPLRAIVESLPDSELLLEYLTD